jgi:hypothetical protein
MIANAERVTVDMPHLQHPVMRLTLTEPKSEEGQALLGLLIGAMARPPGRSVARCRNGAFPPRIPRLGKHFFRV